jgi:NitT/TauT family transport system ATP-binding protein
VPTNAESNCRRRTAREECVSAGRAKAVAPRADREVVSEAPALAVKNVGVTFGGGRGRPVLDDISFDVREGELLCIVGPSGCGKTTLLRLLAGLLRPTSGDISFHGETVGGPSLSRAIVFQDYSNALLPWRTVAGNVSLSLEAGGAPREQRDVEIGALLGKMGLLQAANQYPSQLSGGMQQRVQIARCLAQHPKIMLMDEPFGALDAITRQTLQDELLALAAEHAMTVVFITHDLEEAIYLGDRVFVLGTSPGRIIETIHVELPRPRNQLTTREDWRFLAHRHRLFGLLQGH